MVKCAICGEKVQTTFLNKLVGTYLRNSKGKREAICQNCQKDNTAEELKAKLD